MSEKKEPSMCAGCGARLRVIDEMCSGAPCVFCGYHAGPSHTDTACTSNTVAEPRTSKAFPIRTCESCGWKTTSTSTLDWCTNCRSDGLRPRTTFTHGRAPSEARCLLGYVGCLEDHSAEDDVNVHRQVSLDSRSDERARVALGDEGASERSRLGEASAPSGDVASAVAGSSPIGVTRTNEAPPAPDYKALLQKLVEFVRSDQDQEWCQCCRDYLSVADHIAKLAGLPDGTECRSCDGDGVIGRALERCRRCGGTGRHPMRVLDPKPEQRTQEAMTDEALLDAQRENAAIRRAYLHERQRATSACDALRLYDPSSADQIESQAYRDVRGLGLDTDNPSPDAIRAEERRRAARIVRGADDGAPLNCIADEIEHGNSTAPRVDYPKDIGAIADEVAKYASMGASTGDIRTRLHRLLTERRSDSPKGGSHER